MLSTLGCGQTSTFFDKKVWEGQEKIVIAIDCGTTFSGVAYSYLYPKGRHYVQRVLQWPGQEAHKGEAKIPTVVWYDAKGKACAFGAEALTPEVLELAEKENWQLAEHFKLHLHPPYIRAEHDIVVQPLPTGIGIEQIYADFYGYLYKHTRSFFEEREINGKEIWKRLEDAGKVEWVIACPNGWGPWEHAVVRKAAVLGGVVEEGKANERIQLVSEAEASVHYVMSHADLERRLQSGVEFVVCDAGGSTVDTTVYTAKRVRPILKLKEREASGCIQAGAIFVNQAFRKYFEDILISAGLSGDDLKHALREAMESFEDGPKKIFSGPEQEEDEGFSIYAGGHKLNHVESGIRRGRKILTGTEMESFFMSLADQILEDVEKQLQGHSVKYIMLVGGFGDSPYLLQRFQTNPLFRKIELILANDSTAKAVAEGAVIWNIQHAVTARASRFSYGIMICPFYDPKDARHVGRPHYYSAGGERVSQVWSKLVKKNKVVKVDECVRRHFDFSYDSKNPNLSNTELGIFLLPAEDPEFKPYFMTSPNGDWLHGIQKVCTIRADMSQAKPALYSRFKNKTEFWKANFDILIYFGKTELVAQIAWKDTKGKEHRGPMTVIPEKLENHEV